MTRVATSWVSRELAIFLVFLLSLLLRRMSRHPFLDVLPIFPALFYIVSQGFILYASRAVASWNTALIPLIFLFSGLSSGAGACMLAGAVSGCGNSTPQVVQSVFYVSFSLITWLLYFRRGRFPGDLSDGANATGKRPHLLSSHMSLFTMILPLLFLVAVFIFGNQWEGGYSASLLMGISGLAVILGSAVQKTFIVRSVGYVSGISLILPFSTK